MNRRNFIQRLFGGLSLLGVGSSTNGGARKKALITENNGKRQLDCWSCRASERRDYILADGSLHRLSAEMFVVSNDYMCKPKKDVGGGWDIDMWARAELCLPAPSKGYKVVSTHYDISLDGKIIKWQRIEEAV